MKLAYCRLAVGAALGAVLLVDAELATSATLATAERAAQVIAVRSVTVKDGVVSGELHNQSPRPLRDVQLLIRYTWHWKNEFNPGSDDYGMAVYHTVEKEVSPGGTIPFTYQPASVLPSRPDGYFEISVSVAGFTEIIR